MHRKSQVRDETDHGYDGRLHEEECQKRGGGGGWRDKMVSEDRGELQ